MREVSLLPSSLRLDLLVSATGFSFGSSSDWPSVLSQAVLLACAGQTFTVQVRYKNGCTAAAGAHAQTHFMHMQQTSAEHTHVSEISDKSICAL